MDYTFQDFRIQDLNCKRVSAVAQFKYRGFEVSMSQIFDTPTEVAVFANEGKGSLVFECDTVEAAIEWINDNGR